MSDYINDDNSPMKTQEPAYEQLAVASIPAHIEDSVQPQIAQDEIIELGKDFDYEGYQVVRREFFAHMNEPAITFNNSKVYVNAACINKFKTADFVQILVNRDTKILAIRPCGEGERDSFLWCTENKGKRKAKQITCRIFFAMVADLLDWNSIYRYKMLGKVIHANDEYLIVFDLNSTEVYQRTVTEGEKVKTSRTPVFPEGWKGQFGMPYNEHKKALQINIFDGYAIYGIKDNTPQQKDSKEPDGSEEKSTSSSEKQSLAISPSDDDKL